MTSQPIKLRDGSIRRTGRVIAAACAATLALFVVFNASAVDKGAALSILARELVVYAGLLMPHAITLIAGLTSPGPRTFGFAMALGLITGLVLAVVVAVLGFLSPLSPDRDSSSLLASGVALIALQVVLFRKGQEGQRAAAAMGLRGGTDGAAFAVVYVALLCFVLFPAQARTRAERARARDDAEMRGQLQNQLAQFHDSSSVVSTPSDRDRWLWFIDRCIHVRPDSVRGFPMDLRDLGPAGDGCIDSNMAKGVLGKWRVVYTPSIGRRGLVVGYRLVATDTTGVDPRVTIGIGDTTGLTPEAH